MTISICCLQQKRFEIPRPLDTEEIPAMIEENRWAAELSIDAGFDGVELHAATGYLPNQFQVTGSNRRTDSYGASCSGAPARGFSWKTEWVGEVWSFQLGQIVPYIREQDHIAFQMTVSP